MDQIFPNEIFLRIFRYLPRLDLYRGFYNLNSRLNCIISESRVYFRSKLTEDERLYILPYVQPRQIRTFYVYEKEFQYSKLDQCTNLRQLEFLNGQKYNVYTYEHPQLIHVKPSIFPHLKRLTIYVQSASFTYEVLLILIFNNHFSSLESVYLPYANSNRLSAIKTWSTSLKYVSTSGGTSYKSR
jgi:hypothetical protein